MTSDRADSSEKAGGQIADRRSNWAARFHPGLGLVLAGVLVPGFLWFALAAGLVALDWLARSLGVAEERMPRLGAVLLFLPGSGTVFTLVVLLTLVFPEGRRLLGRTNPDPKARRRYVRLVLWVSVAPFLLWSLAMVVADPLFARSSREGWGWIVEVLGFAAYGLCLLVGLVIIMRLPFRLLARCIIGTVYVALVGFLLFPFTLAVALSISGQAL